MLVLSPEYLVIDSNYMPLNFCLEFTGSAHYPHSVLVKVTNLILANSLLIRFSSNSRALAFRKSAINCTNPRIVELPLLFPRPKKLDPVEDDIPAARLTALIGSTVWEILDEQSA